MIVVITLLLLIKFEKIVLFFFLMPSHPHAHQRNFWFMACKQVCYSCDILNSPGCEGELTEAHADWIKKKLYNLEERHISGRLPALSRSGLASLSSIGFHLALLLTTTSVNNKSSSGCVGGFFASRARGICDKGLFCITLFNLHPTILPRLFIYLFFWAVCAT